MRGGPFIQLIQRETSGKVQHQNINATKVFFALKLKKLIFLVDC